MTATSYNIVLLFSHLERCVYLVLSYYPVNRTTIHDTIPLFLLILKKMVEIKVDFPIIFFELRGLKFRNTILFALFSNDIYSKDR